MITEKRSIMTFTFSDKELGILSTAHQILGKVGAQIPGDYLENADDCDNNLNALDIEVAQHLLSILINGGVPTNWDMEE